MRAILEIVEVQWSPGEQVRFRSVEENVSEENDDEGSNDSPRLVPEKMDTSFTIEDVGKVSMLVESHVRPLEVLCSSAPCFLVKERKVVEELDSRSMFRHALDTDDASRLQFLLDMVRRFSGQKLGQGDEDLSEIFILPESDFTWALAHGKCQMLGLLMKVTGAGIPLDSLVEKSGVEIKQKPRYYQGLTVYGTKRYGDGMASPSRDTLLTAALTEKAGQPAGGTRSRVRLD